MKNIIKTVLSPIAGKKKLQNFFQNIYLLGVYGMNYGNGSYIDKSGELKVLKYINKKLAHKKSLILFDVGANVGKYALEMKNVFGKAAIIHCFEPSINTFNKAKETLEGLDDVIVNNFGVSDQEGETLLFTDKSLSGQASLYSRKLEYKKLELNLTEKIALTTVGDYCSRNHIEEIDFLKMDVEGHELSVLKGAQDFLENSKIRFIQFEFGGCNIDSRTFFKDFYELLSPKYKIYRIVVDGLLPIPNYDEKLEIFITVNYLAELK